MGSQRKLAFMAAFCHIIRECRKFGHEGARGHRVFAQRHSFRREAFSAGWPSALFVIAPYCHSLDTTASCAPWQKPRKGKTHEQELESESGLPFAEEDGKLVWVDFSYSLELGMDEPREGLAKRLFARQICRDGHLTRTPGSAAKTADLSALTTSRPDFSRMTTS